MQRSSASGRTSYRASSWPSPGLPWLGAIRRTRAHRLEARQRARAATTDVPLHVRTSLEILAPDTEAHHAGHRLNLERPASVSGRAQAVRRIRPRDDEAARLRAPLRESTPCCYQHLDASRVNWCPLGHVLVFHYSRVNSPLSSACQTISADAACRSRKQRASQELLVASNHRFRSRRARSRDRSNFADPPIGDLLQRHWIEEKELLAPTLRRGDEMSSSRTARCLVISRPAQSSVSVCPFFAWRRRAACAGSDRRAP
jgi:hypothetical protein